MKRDRTVQLALIGGLVVSPIFVALYREGFDPGLRDAAQTFVIVCLSTFVFGPLGALWGHFLDVARDKQRRAICAAAKTAKESEVDDNENNSHPGPHAGIS